MSDKPREWWIEYYGEFDSELHSQECEVYIKSISPAGDNDVMHVIEYSAYEELETKLEELEICHHCHKAELEMEKAKAKLMADMFYHDSECRLKEELTQWKEMAEKLAISLKQSNYDTYHLEMYEQFKKEYK